MRNKRLWVLLTVCLALALVVGNTALTQFQGPGRGGRGRGGMGGGRGMNPDMIFNFMSQGKDYVEIATMRRDRDQAEEYAKRKGITNGRLTREQFADYMQQRFAQRQAERGATGGTTSADPAKDAFDRLDRNRDGVLADEEIPGTMRSDLTKWDNNRDGKIQLDEYRAFYKANAPTESARSSSSSTLTVTQQNSLEELDKRATVYRAGNLPPELQRTWFEECDTDRDGQVGLYEWKAGGYPVSDFRAMDANGDGFVTAEEALRYVRKNGGGNSSTATAAAGFGRGPGGWGQGGFGRGQGMGGPGGWGNWGQGGGGRRQWGGGGMGPGAGGWQGGGMGGWSRNNRGPSASADGSFGDRQPRNRGDRGGRGGRGQRGGGQWGGPRGGGMPPSWPGSP